MRFDSVEFWVFFAFVLTLYWTLPARRALLIVASYAFYASWNPPFVVLLLLSTGLDFLVGGRLAALHVNGSPEREPAAVRLRKGLLGLSLLGNLGVLFYFKYVGFVLDNLVAIGALTEQTAARGRIDGGFVIPLGISFYTFQTLSYTIDMYRGRGEPVRRFADFLLYVAFFPQLIAGPILRTGEFVPQIEAARPPGRRATLEGVELCLVGLFKKVVIADGFATLVDVVFADPDEFSGGALLVASFCFNCQIYCDFSGYSTMARGLGRLLGYELPKNFDFPLLATNPIEYRRGWHVTMGTWFRDYLYRPLGGERGGELLTARNTMITWMAFGLWHGASWTFVFWGFLNGLLLVAYRFLRARGLLLPPGRLAKLVGLVTMPFFLSLSTIAFRAPTLDDAFTMYTRIATWASSRTSISPLWLAALATLYAIHWLNRRYRTEGFLGRVRWPVRALFVASMVLALTLGAGSGQPFYYFQF